jgi:hypothetical protein
VLVAPVLAQEGGPGVRIRPVTEGQVLLQRDLTTKLVPFGTKPNAATAESPQNNVRFLEEKKVSVTKWSIEGHKEYVVPPDASRIIQLKAGKAVIDLPSGQQTLGEGDTVTVSVGQPATIRANDETATFEVTEVK